MVLEFEERFMGKIRKTPPVSTGKEIFSLAQSQEKKCLLFRLKVLNQCFLKYQKAVQFENNILLILPSYFFQLARFEKP